MLRYATDVHRAHRGSSPARVLVAGRMPDDWSIRVVGAHRGGPAHARRDAPARTRSRRLSDRRGHRRRRRDGRAQPAARGVPARRRTWSPSWRRACRARALLVVVYSNAASLPGRILRRNWRRFFHWKAVYFNSENLRSMLERAGLRFVAQSGLNTSYTVTRALDLALPGTPVAGVARRLGLGAATVRVPDGDLRVDLRARRRVGGERAVVSHRAGVQRGRVPARGARRAAAASSSSSRTRSSSSRATAPTARARSRRPSRGAPGSRSSTRTGRAAKARPSAAD